MLTLTQNLTLTLNNMIGLKAVKTVISENSNPKGNVVHKAKRCSVFFFKFY